MSKFAWTPHRQKMVRNMMLNDQPLQEIARTLGCSRDTLRRYLDGPAPK